MVSRTTGTGSPARRIFLAVTPPAETLATLGDRLDPLLIRWPQLRWTDPAGWHITCAFLGQVSADQYPRLIAELTDLAAQQARFDLTLAGSGGFPAPAIAKQLWLRADDPMDALTGLARGCRRAAARAGIRADDRQFVGHLTLARCSQPTDLSQQIDALAGWSFDPFPVSEFAVFESKLGQGIDGRPRYVRLDSFALAAH